MWLLVREIEITTNSPKARFGMKHMASSKTG